VDSDDPRIKGSCMVVLEEGDPGTFDRGAPTRKLVHQLSSTSDPVLSLRVPASRIVGGYEVRDGVIVPNHDHAEVIEAVFRRTRVTVGLMTAAKLLSAIEPIVRYQRGRFRGSEGSGPGSPRYEQGLQQKEDALQRLIDVWATGEASASLGFAAARLFDELEPLEAEKDRLLAAEGVTGGRAAMRALARVQDEALAAAERGVQPESSLARFALKDALANVLCPAVKLWNTGHGANTMREALSLMGGYGITEDCPGFLGHKWMDAQLEAIYEGPEAVQRRQLSVTMTHPLFLAQVRRFVRELRELGGRRADTGACTLATAFQAWLWTLEHLRTARDGHGDKLYQGARHGVTFALADALAWLLAARALVLDVVELEEKGASSPVVADALPGLVSFYADLAHVQSARAAGEAARICAELVFGYGCHPEWDAEACAKCFHAEELEELESFIPGLEAGALGQPDVIGPGDAHPRKAGPCVRFTGREEFVRLRVKLDGCLTGARLAKDRAAAALARVTIPEALDYPA
jgi:alkylation response protein AidB-like acyl-CoA dehydrogenase